MAERRQFNLDSEPWKSIMEMKVDIATIKTELIGEGGVCGRINILEENKPLKEHINNPHPHEIAKIFWKDNLWGWGAFITTIILVSIDLYFKFWKG